MDKPVDQRHGVRDVWPLLLVLLLGLVLRGAYLGELVHTPDFAVPLADAAFHDYWARALATGNWAPPEGNADPRIPATPYLRPPGYPYFLALVYLLAGPGNYVAVRIVQMSLGLVSAVLAYRLGRKLLGRGAGLLAALFLCTHWAFLYYEGELQEPCLLVLLGLLMVLAFQAWAARPAPWRAVLAGLLLGVFALVRANILLFALPAAVWMVWVLRGQGDRRRAISSSVSLLVGVALPIAPVTVRNYAVARDFVLISSNGAINLYIGNNERSDGYTARIPELYELTGENTWSWFNYGKIVGGLEAQAGRPLKYSEVSAHFRGKALTYLREKPLRCLGLAAKRGLLFWGPAEVANNKEVHFERRFSRWLRWLPGFPLAAATAALGLLILWRERRGRLPPTTVQWPPVVLIVLLVLVWFASFVPFLVAERFRVVIAPFLAVLGGYGVSRLGRWAVAREWRRLAAWSVAGVGLLTIAEVNWARYDPQPSAWHMARGDGFAQRGEWDHAVAEYSRAIELKPTYLAAREVLASVLYHQGRLDEALQQYQALLEWTPDDPKAHNNVGGLLLDLDRPGEAEQAFSRSLRLDPSAAGVHINRGTALMRSGRLDEAIEAYRAALAADPRLALAYYNLGLALTAQGAAAEAVAAYRAALELEPLYTEARVNLGVLLAGQGEVDAAIAEYRAVLARDPTCFEALYNLAAALGGKGQVDEAAALLRQALHVRPDNDHARRALQALEQRAGGPATGGSHAP